MRGISQFTVLRRWNRQLSSEKWVETPSLSGFVQMQNRLLQWIDRKLENFIPDRCQGCGFKPGMRQALEETKELFLAFADSMPVPLIVSSLATGTVLYCNDLCDLAFGVTASELI
ncbi:MAG: hypothetical protein ACRC62_11365, partial [Microcoleus sp.]